MYFYFAPLLLCCYALAGLATSIIIIKDCATIRETSEKPVLIPRWNFYCLIIIRPDVNQPTHLPVGWQPAVAWKAVGYPAVRFERCNGGPFSPMDYTGRISMEFCRIFSYKTEIP